MKDTIELSQVYDAFRGLTKRLDAALEEYDREEDAGERIRLLSYGDGLRKQMDSLRLIACLFGDTKEERNKINIFLDELEKGGPRDA